MFVELLIVPVLAGDKGDVSTWERERERARSTLLPLHSPPSIPPSSFYSNRSLGVEAFKQMERVYEPQPRDADMLGETGSCYLLLRPYFLYIIFKNLTKAITFFRTLANQNV